MADILIPSSTPEIDRLTREGWFPVMDPQTGATEWLDVPMVTGDDDISYADRHALLRALGVPVELIKDKEERSCIEFECGLTLDGQGRRVLIESEPLSDPLTPREFDIFALLAHNRSTTYSASQIHDILWGRENGVKKHTVRVHMRNLRLKLGANDAHLNEDTGAITPAGPNNGLIITKPSFGWMIGPRIDDPEKLTKV